MGAYPRDGPGVSPPGLFKALLRKAVDDSAQLGRDAGASGLWVEFSAHG